MRMSMGSITMRHDVKHRDCNMYAIFGFLLHGVPMLCVFLFSAKRNCHAFVSSSCTQVHLQASSRVCDRQSMCEHAFVRVKQDACHHEQCSRPPIPCKRIVRRSSRSCARLYLCGQRPLLCFALFFTRNSRVSCWTSHMLTVPVMCSVVYVTRTSRSLSLSFACLVDASSCTWCFPRLPPVSTLFCAWHRT